MRHPTTVRSRRRSPRIHGVGALLGVLVLTAASAVPGLPDTPAPTLRPAGVVETSPFAGARTAMKDNEGSAYVPRDRSLWLADDDGERLYEVSAKNGKLRRTIRADELEDAPRHGGGHRAGKDRVGDLESLAYDVDSDRLFAFSGSCCDAKARPTAFRLTRHGSGKLTVESYQPLPVGSDFTAAAWNAADDRIYIGNDDLFWSYRYNGNVVGTPLAVAGLDDVLGMTFTSDGASLVVTRWPAVLSRVDWATRTVVPGWTVDLTFAGVVDARAVEIVHGRLWVSDGYDLRAPGDPLGHAVFVFDVL